MPGRLKEFVTTIAFLTLNTVVCLIAKYLTDISPAVTIASAKKTKHTPAFQSEYTCFSMRPIT